MLSWPKNKEQSPVRLEFPNGKRPAAINEADEPMTATPPRTAVNIFDMTESATADFHSGDAQKSPFADDLTNNLRHQLG